MSRKHLPYRVLSTDTSFINLIPKVGYDRYGRAQITMTTFSSGKNALTDEFHEFAKASFTGKWSVRLKTYVIDDSTNTICSVKWEFRFRKKDDAMLMKLMS